MQNFELTKLSWRKERHLITGLVREAFFQHVFYKSKFIIFFNVLSSISFQFPHPATKVPRRCDCTEKAIEKLFLSKVGLEKFLGSMQKQFFYCGGGGGPTYAQRKTYNRRREITHIYNRIRLTQNLEYSQPFRSPDCDSLKLAPDLCVQRCLV
jgi:hypothetical protein